MTRAMPKVPPAGRSPKGPPDPHAKSKVQGKGGRPPVPENLAEQDQQGSTVQNTRQQRHKTDR